MDKWLEITALILLPLAWGLAVEWLFGRIRARQRSGTPRRLMGPDDWTI